MSLETRNFYPRLQRNETPTSSGSTVVSYTSDLGAETPILTLIHGYPQSSFEWRYLIPNLIKTVSLFVPELPGYGISTPSSKNSRKDIGGTLLEALQATFKSSPNSPRRVILGGHDRGARISHCLAVSKAEFTGVEIIGTVILDIVPTKTQWELFQNPSICSRTFHWPMLANVEVAVKMISAFGGGNWCRSMHERSTGSGEGPQRVSADGALDVYAQLFEKEETLRYSCEDYATGATPEYQEQKENQENGKKITVPTLIMYSHEFWGIKIDLTAEWKNWVAPDVDYEAVAVKNGAGHYLPEEAHELVSEKIIAFLKRLEI